MPCCPFDAKGIVAAFDATTTTAAIAKAASIAFVVVVSMTSNFDGIDVVYVCELLVLECYDDPFVAVLQTSTIKKWRF